MELPLWMVSSTGEGLSRRVTSALTLAVTVAGYLGFQITGLDATAAGEIVQKIFVSVTGFIGLYNQITGWYRAIVFKKAKMGKFAPNFRA